MVAWKYYLLCSRPPVESAERMCDATIANLKSNRHPNAASITDYVVARHNEVIAAHPTGTHVYCTRLEHYASHLKNKANHGGRYSEALDEMRSTKASEVRAGLNLVRVSAPPPSLSASLAAEAEVLAQERQGKYAHVEEVPIQASYDPQSLLLHTCTLSSTDYLCKQIMDAKHEVVMQTFIYAQGCLQAQRIAEALIAKQDRLRRDSESGLRVVMALNWPRGAMAPRLLKASERCGFLGSGSFTNRAGELDETPEVRGTSLQALCGLLDPKFIELTVVGLRHVGRSLHHKKQYAFDAEHAHIPTYNIAGPHTPSEIDGVTLPGTRDIAVSFSGLVAATGIRNDIMRACRRWGEVLLRSGTQTVTAKQSHKILAEQFKPLPLRAPRPQDTAQLIIAEQDIAPAWFDVASLGHMSPAYAVIKCLLAGARESLCLMTPNLQIFDILAQLEEAMTRGVQVRLLLTEHENEESAQLAGLTNEQSVALLKQFAADHRLAHLLDVRWSREQLDDVSSGASDGGDGETIIAPHGWSPGAIHAKLYIADGRFVGTGSYNLDYQSFKSSEDMVIIEQNTVDNPFTRYFQEAHRRGALQRRYPEEALAPSAVLRAAAILCQTRPAHGRFDIRDLEAEQFMMGRRELLRAVGREGASTLRNRLQATVRRLELHRPQNRPWLDNLIEHLRRAQHHADRSANCEALLHELQVLRGGAVAATAP